jgi:hypothetical protein
MLIHSIDNYLGAATYKQTAPVRYVRSVRTTVCLHVESGWNVMAHGDAQEGKWRGNWRMEWVVSTLHTTSEHGVSSITTADVHSSAASSRLNWRLRRFKWALPIHRKTKSGFCACAITFQMQSTNGSPVRDGFQWNLILAILGKYVERIQMLKNRAKKVWGMYMMTWYSYKSALFESMITEEV